MNPVKKYRPNGTIILVNPTQLAHKESYIVS